jgi:subtilase family serine protease
LDNRSYLKSRVGDSVSVRARIHNVGHSNAEDVEVVLYEDKTVRGRKTISYIAALSYADVDFKWVVVAEEVEVRVEATPMEEIDEANNAVSPIFLDLRPDLSFDDEELNFSEFNPAPNEEITVTAFVKNDGGNVEDVVIKFYYGSKIIGTENIDIDYGKTGKASVTWKVPNEPGKKLEVRAEIDKHGWGIDEISRSIKVREKEEGELFDYLWIILIIIVGLAAFFAGYFLKGRGKGEQPESEEGEKGIGEKVSPSGNAMESKMMLPPPPPPPPPQPSIDQWLNEGVEPSGETES